MMLLSVESFVMREKFDDETAIRMIREAGFDAMDYSFYWCEHSPDMLGDDYLETAHRLREQMDAVGLLCNQTHAPFELSYNDPSAPLHWERLRRSLEFSGILGAKHCIIHSVGVPKGVNVLDYNTDFYQKLTPFCAKYGVKIGVENLFERDERRQCFRGRFGTPEELNALMDRLDERYFGVCIDLGHSSLTGVDPEDFIRGIGTPRLQALHVQDNDFLNDRHILPWMGCLDWNAIAHALAETDYAGELTLEVFGFLNRYDKEMLPTALRFAHDTGRELLRRIEACR